MEETMNKYVDEDGVFHQNWGLVKGRHDMPVDGYIFDEPIDSPLDFELLEKKADEWTQKLYDWMNDSARGADSCWWHNGYLGTPEGEEWNINLYVTGLTSALIALIGSFSHWGIAAIRFYHYDNATGEYVMQECESLNNMWSR